MKSSITRGARLASALGGALLLFAPTLAQAAPPTHAKASERGLEAAARSVQSGGRFVIEGLALQGEATAATLDLERIEVWRPSATVLVDGREVTPPATLYFRGSVAGDEGSAVLVSVRESGEMQGLVRKGGNTWMVGKGRTQKGMKSTKVNEADVAPFECGNDDAFSVEERLGSNDPAPVTANRTVLDRPYVANLAIETDYEYYARFGNTTAALDYMADLIGYSDLTYSREINTDMQIGFARLWTTGATNDPWSTSPANGTSGALDELRAYWNANMGSVNRTLVHQLSGRSLGGGIAYIGILCNRYGSSSPYDYGLSASLGTNFSWDGNQTHNPSNVVWDIVVVQHEIGHNFNSPHGHDYCNIGGNALPIDNCWSGCQAGATVQLPSCSAPTPHFTSGGGSGTIMSYCHQRSGGYGNIAMTFGKDHTCGTAPSREASRMTDHVVSRAASYPACFASSACGNGTIDPGEQCDGGNLNGGTCSGQGFAGGTLSCSTTCTFNTNQCTNCGNNVINAGEVCDGTALGGGTCSSQGCTGGTLACNGTCSGYNKVGCTGCPVCDGDGICEPGENCNGCPSDCAGGTTSGAVCGNGVCEAGNGEDCVSCGADCNGVQGGKPNGRYCCGDGGGSNPLPCSDSKCTASGRVCTNVTVNPSTFCCGNSICENAENCSVCGLDCGSPSESCGNGIDDNCNGLIDCADGACSSLPACQCSGSGLTCSSNSQCCSGSCRTRGKNVGTCN